MGPRRTNLTLLVVLVAALATGGLAFAAGTGWGRPVVVGHAVTGLAVLVLAPWKSVIVRRGLAKAVTAAAARAVLAEGRAVLYNHDAANHTSARVAESVGLHEFGRCHAVVLERPQASTSS